MKLPEQHERTFLEYAVLGRMVEFPRECLAVGLMTFDAEDFSVPMGQDVFAELKRLGTTDAPVEMPAICRAVIATRRSIEKHEKSDLADLLGFFAKAWEHTIGPENFGYYTEHLLDVVRGSSLRASLANLVQDVSDTRELRSSTEEALRKSQTHSVKPSEPFSETLKHEIGSIGEEREIMPTCVKAIDRSIKGLARNRLYILAARPGVGKTALAIQVATDMSMRGVDALFVSLEMTKEDLGQRIIAQQTGVPIDSLNSGALNGAQRLRIEKFAKQIIEEPVPLNVKEAVGLRISELDALCYYTKHSQGLDLVVVDYLTLLKAEEKKTSREQEVAEVSRGLKSIAMRYDCAVLALAQLNREVDKRDGGRPRLSDLRDSGQIEQDADLVAFLYRDEKYADQLSMSVDKFRHGQPTKFVIPWNAETTSFKTGVRFDRGGDSWSA